MFTICDVSLSCLCLQTDMTSSCLCLQTVIWLWAVYVYKLWYDFWAVYITSCDVILICLYLQTDMTLSCLCLQAAATPTHPLIFQIEYIQLRTKLLQSYVGVMHACCSFQTSPPPAIATSLALTTGLEKHRCDHVLTQVSLQSCN